MVYSGVPGAPGIGMGTGVVIHAPFDLDTMPDREPEDMEAEIDLVECSICSCA